MIHCLRPRFDFQHREEKLAFIVQTSRIDLIVSSFVQNIKIPLSKDCFAILEEKNYKGIM